MLRRVFFIILAIDFFVQRDAFAGAVCDDLRKDSPHLFSLYCTKDGGSGNTKPAGTNSSFSESFKINPASLGTEKSLYGIEVIPTRLENGAGPKFPNISLIKGFHRFGTGISTTGGNTFFSNDLYQRVAGSSKLKSLDDPEPAKGKFTNLNVGTSFLLLNMKAFPRVQLGLSGRYNRITNTVGGGPAILLSTRYLSAGYGLSREKVSNYFPITNFQTFIVSLRLLALEIEYNQTSTPAGATTSTLSSSTNVPPTQILSASYPIHNFIFTIAGRKLQYLKEGDITQYHFAVQFFATPHIAVGFMHNYLPGGNSIGTQFYL